MKIFDDVLETNAMNGDVWKATQKRLGFYRGIESFQKF